MYYKIVAKENFDIILPQMTELNSNMAVELLALCEKTIEKKRSVIIDFNNVESIKDMQKDTMQNIHTSFYKHNLSFAVCEIKKELKPHFSKKLNITPTLIEAIDIISMEALEREILDEE